MIKNLTQIFTSKNRDLLKRILFTLAALFVFKIGTAIIVPGVKVSTSGMSFLEVINAMSGGAFTRASIFALGVTPYITAQIVIQLLCADIVPYLAELSKQGGVGRRKLDQITRIVGIILAFLQGYLYSYAYIGNGSAMDYMLYSLILTAGTAFLMWVADQITIKGIGNGMSLMIMAGIISVLPNMFKNLWVELFAKGFIGIATFAGFVLVFIAIIVGVIYVESAERRIPIQYANKSTSALGKQTYIPFKLNSAGVMPVIFASALLSMPQILSSVLNKEGFTLFVQKYLTYTNGIGLIVYMILILAFAYFYTFMQLKPNEMSENLQKNGGYIPGIRPGSETKRYVKSILIRITTFGSAFLVIIAALPILFSNYSNVSNANITLGGTGILIVVGVALETYKQIESVLSQKEYKGRL